jgi:hypothetical protein
MIANKYSVHSIDYQDCKEWFLKKHYAKRIPSVSYAFGLFDGNVLNGVCSFGTPASSNLLKGVCGNEFSGIVKELNRLVINDDLGKNVASYFIGQCFKLLPNPMIIVSYADTSQNHNGYIYQATNFIYTGLSEKRSDWKLKGLEHLHGATIADISRGKENRSEWMKEKYGDDFYLKERSRKHRYIYFLGDKRQKRNMMKSLNYPIKDYPKGESKKYNADYNPSIQLKIF